MKLCTQCNKITYGVDEQFVEELNKNQNGLCAICKESADMLHLDHDHATGKIRGLLCRYCNSMLGFARDNPDILESGIEYLKQQHIKGTYD